MFHNLRSINRPKLYHPSNLTPYNRLNVASLNKIINEHGNTDVPFIVPLTKVVYRIESLHPSRHHVMHAVNSDTIKVTIRSYSQQMQSNSERKTYIFTSRPSHRVHCKQKHDNRLKKNRATSPMLLHTPNLLAHISS
jgi:hypothetical protein